jgi:succinylarginine dihydrolase
LIATLSRIAEQVGTTKAAAARTVHVHSASVDLVYVMNLPNAFDQTSVHLESLAAVNVQVKFHHQTTKLRYGERKLMHEWLRLSARIARRQALFAKGTVYVAMFLFCARD